jgi:hypothetical protein
VSEYTTRRISPRRRQTDLVCRIAFAGALVFGLGLVLVEMLNDWNPTGAGRPFEVVAAASTMVAFIVGVVSAAIGALVFPSRGYWAPSDNLLPAWGRWARLVARIGIRLFWVVLVAFLLTVVPATIEQYVDVVPDTSLDDAVWTAMAACAQGAIAVMVVAGVVWLTAELVTGFRERRTPG